MSTQRVFLVPHDPGWAKAFLRESSAVASAMSGVLVEIHHIGSTAIPGIHAKPIIDLLAAVSDVSLVDEIAPRLEALGYEAMGEFGMPGRRYFRKNNAHGERTHQIHAFASGSPQIARHLAFRDFLRAHPDCAGQYDALKQQLAARYPAEIGAIRTGKTHSSGRSMRGRRFGGRRARRGGHRIISTLRPKSGFDCISAIPACLTESARGASILQSL